METRNSCFQATFHQENMGEFPQPSSTLFMDLRMVEEGCKNGLVPLVSMVTTLLSCKLEDALMPTILG